MSEALQLKVEELSTLVRSQAKTQQELSATLRSQARSQRRYMVAVMLDKLTGGVGGEVKRTCLLNGLTAILASSSSVESIRDIIADGAALEFEISLLKEVYQEARNRGFDSLRKVTAQMLGSLMLKSDSKPEDIEFLEDDLPSVFSSTAYPQLLNEDEYFEKMEEAFMFFGPNENGLPPAEKEKLLLLLDLPMLSVSNTRIVEDYLEHNDWGQPVLADLRMRQFARPTREYKLEPAVH